RAPDSRIQTGHDYSSQGVAGSPCAYLETFPSRKARKLVQLQESCRFGGKTLAGARRSAQRVPQTGEAQGAVSQHPPLAPVLVGRQVDDRRRRARELAAVELEV